MTVWFTAQRREDGQHSDRSERHQLGSPTVKRGSGDGGLGYTGPVRLYGQEVRHSFCLESGEHLHLQILQSFLNLNFEWFGC